MSTCRNKGASTRKFALHQTPGDIKKESSLRVKLDGLYINKVQQDAKVCRFLFTANHSTCFGRLSHPSSGVHKTVNAASGTGHIT